MARTPNNPDDDIIWRTDGLNRKIKFSVIEKLTAARIIFGWSQYDVANAIEVSQSYISRLERGYIDQPRLSVLRRYGQLFKLEINLEFEELPAPKSDLDGITDGY